MGLNNVHLKLEVNGAAASQRNSMTSATDRKKDRDEIFCRMTGGRRHGKLYGRIQTDRQALGKTGSQNTVHLNTHVLRALKHTPLSERYRWEVDPRRDVQVIDDRVSMNWN